MCACEVSVPEGIGLHSRSAACFINKAKAYKSFIWLKHDGNLVNAKSLFEVLSLGVNGGFMVEILADGVDEEQAVEELVDFIKSLN